MTKAQKAQRKIPAPSTLTSSPPQGDKTVCSTCAVPFPLAGCPVAWCGVYLYSEHVHWSVPTPTTRSSPPPAALGAGTLG